MVLKHYNEVHFR